MSVRTNLKIRSVIVALVLITAAPTFAGKIIYVDDDATGVKDGSSWANAYKYLQDALAAAYSGDEICVAQGIYKPDRGTRITHRDRDATFQLINGVTLNGGYAGVGAPDPNARDIELYETILSGDLNGDDGPNFANNDENSYQVVNGSGTDATAVLDGVTITAGNANGTGTYGYGSGMYNDMGSPTLTNCTFNRNWADGSGGGMYNYDGRPTLINCTFSDNSAGDKGGGVYSHDTYEMTLINCRFSGNSAGEDGGGMACWYNYNNSPTLTNCIFSGNSAGNKGGGMSFVESEPVLSNCSFSGNSAGNKGGGIYMNFWYGYPVLTNCILWGNSDFAGMAESAQINTDSYGPPVINYICVQGWTGVLGGIGNIGADPCFVEPGYWDANGVWVEGDYHLLSGSQCIDAGDPNYIAEPDEKDLDGNPRVINGRIDMGAYEFQGHRILYVDDDAPNDPGPGDPQVSDPLEDGSQAHPFDSIQEAIDGAYDADVIIVLDGTYAKEGWKNNPVIDFSGKAITVRSENGPENCILYRGNYVVRFRNGETNTSVLSGFTITGADPSAGIGCWNSSPTIMNNVITGNWSEYGLGSVLLHNSSALVIGNVITANQVYGPCAGIYVCHGSSATITNNTIVGNGGDGGWYGTGGVHCTEDSTATITNCIFWNNGDYDLYGCSATYSCLEHEHSGTGNIHSDPVFVNPGHWENYSWVDFDYHLLAGSPCINAGAPDYTPQPNETDLDGKPRVVGGRIDMGAYESPVLLAELRIVPQTINLASKGNWITCYIWLPDQYNVADIDPNSIFLEDEIQPEDFSVDQQKQVATATFDREKVQSILNVGDIELTITCQLNDGTSFEATDTIKVTDKAGK